MHTTIQRLSLILLFLIPLIGLQAQSLFQKVYHDYDIRTYDVVELPAGGFVISGLAGDSTTNLQSAMIARLSCAGKIEWVRTFGQASATGATSGNIILDDDGNLVAIHNRSFTGDFDALVIKIDQSGNTIWQRTVGGTNSDAGLSLIQTSDGGYVVSGFTRSFLSNSTSFQNIYLFKLDKGGNLLWTQSYGVDAGQSQADEVVEAPDGGLVMVGRTFVRGYFHAFIMKTSSTGVAQWVKAYGGDNASTQGLDIVNTADGGFAITGFTSIANGSWNANNDLFVIKTDGNGDTLWTRIFTNSFTQGPTDRELGYQLIEAHDGNLAVVGITYSFPFTGFVSKKLFLVRVDITSGQKMMAKTYGKGNDDYPSIHPTTDGGYALIGFTGQPSYNMVGPFGGYLIRMDDTYSSGFGCDEADVTNGTFAIPPGFWVFDTTFANTSGGTAAPATTNDPYTLQEYTVCKNWTDIEIATQNDTICPGETAWIIATTDPQTVVYWYASDTSDSIVYTGDTFPVPDLTGTVTYYAEALGGPDCDTVRTPATITFLGIPPINITADPNPAVYPEVTVDFTSSNHDGISTWHWSFADGDSSIVPDPTHTYADPGLYEVVLDLMDTSGCPQTHPILVDVQGDTLGIPNVLTPNGDGFNDLLTAQHFGITSFTIVVFDRWGRQHYQSNTKEFQWDAKNELGIPLNEGVYYYIVKGETYLGEEKQFAGNLTILR
ncbi:MAG: gliding motility-associated C-terminal domain-containing protein [Bacteroidia bacterium]|nr:gliding motility-associated C-terminal domain-containing protein [Bacteroidia bacterium]